MQPTTASNTKSEINRLDDLRMSALNWSLKAFLIVGLPILVVNIITEIRYHLYEEVHLEEMLYLYSTYIFLYVLALIASIFKKMGYAVRTSMFLSIFFIFGITQFWLFGISSSGDMLLLHFVIFAGMLINIRAGILALCSCISVLLVFGHLYSSGIISITRQQQMLSDDMGDWLNVSLLLAFLGASALTIIALIQKKLAKNVDDSLALVTNLNREVDERRKAEQEAKENAEKYRLLADNAADVISISDLNFRSTYVSPSVVFLRGFQPDEVTQQSIQEMVTPRSLAVITKLMEEELKLEEQGADPLRTRTVELEMIHKHGGTIWAELKVSFIRDNSGKPIGLLSVSRDINDRKQAEEKAAKLEAQLRQAQKMEAVGQLAGGIAHDFNNLLQIILGYGELLMHNLPPDTASRDHMNNIMGAGKRARLLISQLLAFSRRQVLEMQDVDLNDVITNLMKMIRRVIGEHIALDILPGHDLGIIRADRGQLEQILLNLCVNARDAMSTGGRISIETENVRIDDNFRESHPWVISGRYVLLSVTDTGCGIESSMIDKVFEPFFTTKEQGQGTGLGLSTVYGLVKQHDGFIHIYSEVDHGTTFKIYFPIAERSATTVGDKIEGTVPTGHETILVAEDDQMVREISQTFLEDAGYTVLTACDGKEALAVFNGHADKIELVLLDVMMPKMGGRAVFEAIRKSGNTVPVLFSSGYSMNAVHTNFVLDEGMQLIQKPYDRNGLLRKLREVLGDTGAA